MTYCTWKNYTPTFSINSDSISILSSIIKSTTTYYRPKTNINFDIKQKHIFLLRDFCPSHFSYLMVKSMTSRIVLIMKKQWRHKLWPYFVTHYLSNLKIKPKFLIFISSSSFVYSETLINIDVKYFSMHNCTKEQKY